MAMQQAFQMLHFNCSLKIGRALWEAQPLLERQLPLGLPRSLLHFHPLPRLFLGPQPAGLEPQLLHFRPTTITLTNSILIIRNFLLSLFILPDKFDEVSGNVSA